MDIEQHEYIDQLTQTAGAAVLISPRGQMPFPYEEGLSLAPGYATSMGLRMVSKCVTEFYCFLLVDNHFIINVPRINY